jgi:diguanylate cyclase (GGDEF)-like protein/PAS domain S-box-containing protein
LSNNLLVRLWSRFWSRLTFAARLMLSAAVILGASTAILLVTSTVRDALTLNGDLERQLQNELAAQLPLLTGPVVDGDYAAIQRILDERAHRPNIRRLVWRGADGTLVDVAGDLGIVHAPAWFANAVGIADPIGSRPVSVDGRSRGALVVTMSMVAGIDRLWADFLSYHNLLVLTVGLQLLGMVLIVRYGLRPLDALVAGARRLGGGDLAARIEPGGGPEMRQTIAAFNRMAEDLGATLTELDRSRASLMENEARFRAIFEQAPVGMAEVERRSGRFVRVNKQLAEIFGESRENAQAKVLSVLTEADGKSDASAPRNGDEPARERPFLRPDGSEVWTNVTISPMAVNGAGVDHEVVIVQDVTERKRAELELRIAAAAFDSEEAMVVTDADQIILRVNRAFIEITGYEAEDVLGSTPRMLLSSDHDDSAYRQTWTNVARDKFWQGEIWGRHKGGRVYPIWQSISAVLTPEGQASHYVVAFNDISQRKDAEEQIRNLAFFDSLTQLPNRRLLIDRLGLALAAATRHHRHGALLFLDLDYFKTLNDTEGHDAGDQLLIELSRRLRTCVREGDTVARLGGDEFVVMLEDLSDNADDAAAQAETVGQKILESVAQPFPLKGRDYHGTLSIGICLFDDSHPSIDELLKRADVAMYQAKSGGRNTWRFFDPLMQEALVARAVMENDLRRVVAQGQLVLYYQPQLDENNHVLGAEALLRWQHPLRGLVPPAEFIPLAEETGLILPIGNWVMETACRQLRTWQDNPLTRDLLLAVNVSAKQFHQADFVDRVKEIIERTGANPTKLKLELTESVIIDDIADTVDKMKTLKSLGIGFSMDDFGTGYSSLSYLRRLPLDQLKIDRSFVNEVETNSGDAVIVQTIIGMARSLGLDVIAEGVEKAGQREFLNRNDCPTFQGFLFSQAVPVSIFETLLGQEPGSGEEQPAPIGQQS